MYIKQASELSWLVRGWAGWSEAELTGQTLSWPVRGWAGWIEWALIANGIRQVYSDATLTGKTKPMFLTWSLFFLSTLLYMYFKTTTNCYSLSRSRFNSIWQYPNVWFFWMAAKYMPWLAWVKKILKYKMLIFELWIFCLLQIWINIVTYLL